MNWEAVLVIGGFSVLLGIVLYVPGRWWAKRKLREAPAASAARVRVTRAGLVFYGIMILFLMIGLFQEHLAPQSRIGEFVSTRVGRLAFVGAYVGVSVLIENMLTRLGFTFVRRIDQ